MTLKEYFTTLAIKNTIFNDYTKNFGRDVNVLKGLISPQNVANFPGIQVTSNLPGKKTKFVVKEKPRGNTATNPINKDFNTNIWCNKIFLDDEYVEYEIDMKTQQAVSISKERLISVPETAQEELTRSIAAITYELFEDIDMDAINSIYTFRGNNSNGNTTPLLFPSIQTNLVNEKATNKFKLGIQAEYRSLQYSNNPVMAFGGDIFANLIQLSSYSTVDPLTGQNISNINWNNLIPFYDGLIDVVAPAVNPDASTVLTAPLGAVQFISKNYNTPDNWQHITDDWQFTTVVNIPYRGMILPFDMKSVYDVCTEEVTVTLTLHYTFLVKSSALMFSAGDVLEGVNGVIASEVQEVPL